MHTTDTRRWLATGAIAFLATLASATNLLAQSPTPEGTTITNTATASWTDANGNTYTPVSASASVIVGYLAAPDVTSPATVTPASPSTGNQIPFTISNSGNGTDQYSVATSAGTGVTITGYSIGATSYATLADLNTALAAMNVAAGGNVVVNVVYSVASGRGGLTTPVSLTATSVRTPAATGASDASTTNVIPPVAAAVAVTPDNGAVSRLPSNGTVQYTATFTVTNNGNSSDTYNLASSTGASITLVSLNGSAGTTGSVTIAAGGSATVDVVYMVNNVPAGTTVNVTLSATSANAAATSDAGNYVVTVVRPALTIAKAAFRDNQTDAINSTTDRVVPGEFIQYRITVTNAGSAAASSVSVSDALPAEVMFVSTSSDAAGWTISEAAGTVSASLSGTLATSGSRFFWVRVQVR